ncbi:VOC family protein [Rhodohalobacter sp. 8-1]|uniref:VOC family protein n=1 Tax=Rhodohalobacter sp. 8-1 TaxID=3131972 RepID=UPI0030EBABA4
MILNGIAETCLYATDLEEAEQFYKKVLNLKVVMKEENRHVFFKCGESMLLVFNPEHTRNKQTDVDGNPVPLHGADGSVHIAFSVDPANFDTVKESIEAKNITIESEISWPNQSRSFYFRDPAGNSLEVITTNMWK